MHAFAFTLFSLIYTFSSVVSGGIITKLQSEEIADEGFYWRDYTGTIPSDAFPGGKNSNGNTTYIGQVLHEKLLIPAKVDPEQKRAFYEWGYKEFEATQNVKILCTTHPENFEWVSTGNGLINNITDKNFVVGGYEPRFSILIGRKQLKDELSIGKVVFSKTQSTLNTTKDGKGIQHGVFEVLCYNPNIKTNQQKKDNQKNDKNDDKKGDDKDIIQIIDVRYNAESE